ncbi:Hypothetical protein Nlim_1301 [Candidatus Nitrosarchaeum limnium SFB1]|jgi:hypothetical protein|uniref:Uncharacterized protein n=1 Tax=Candidatus Nitrosarchaeum limnium SFB1 TaxID=886738 RepID=F3KLC2_9ARCH|nr:Hypothetical protein Nlim_1301 [Candidatus Nitrosarchaeum limnium SFB1]
MHGRQTMNSKLIMTLSKFLVRLMKTICDKLEHHNQSCKEISYKGTGDVLVKFIEHLSNGVEEIHDLKIKFSGELHKHLLKKGHVENKSNKGIFLEIPTGEKYLTVKISIYPKTIHIDIGCSNEPFTYDSMGALRLSSLLSRIENVLRITTENKAEICDVGKWMIVHRHCGIDGNIIELTGNAFNITINELNKDFIRGYTKILPDGRIIPRLEVTNTEQITVNQLIQNMTRKISFKITNLIQTANRVKSDPN